ncbi:MAG: CPBP family intramembrane metalloprotease [Verrucomicrobia bacterium]|nr:CPBP family intramembrane metalloprotease [Verrucomicrobiota bacterium]
MPPVLPGERTGRVRWWIHLAVLGSYPIALGLVSVFAGETRSGPLLSNDTGKLVFAMGIELGIFAAVFAIAWFASRANRDQLFLRWRGTFAPVWWGLAYSIGLRVGIAIVVAGVAALLALTGNLDPDAIQSIRPRTETIVDTAALVNDPVYLVLNLTLVSFVVAGFREELWRAGVIAALVALSPSRFRGFLGYGSFVLIAAVLFGLGHLPQGWGGVVLTTVLGLGLGGIMIRHRSVWEAVIAHGFFDATTFAALALLTRYYPDLLSGG